MPILLILLTMAARFAGAAEPIKLVRIPAGEFQMGSDRQGEKPRHPVRIRSFELAVTEVTVRQFKAFTQASGYVTDGEKEGWSWACCWSKKEGLTWRSPGFAQSDDDPAVALSWHDAMEFIRWLSKETGQSYRLPSEAEWEYAARAGNSDELPADVPAVAWFKDNSGGRTRPVAQKQPNAWGLYDILGNVWEWTSDVFNEEYTGAPSDGSPRLEGGSARRNFAAGDGRALRGGGWGLERDGLRFAWRPAFGIHERCNNSGFRVAR